jgi:hypothetical protein
MVTTEEIATVNALLAVFDALSLTCTVKVKLAELVGVPASVPLEGFRLVPAGMAPAVIDHE